MVNIFNKYIFLSLSIFVLSIALNPAFGGDGKIKRFSLGELDSDQEWYLTDENIPTFANRKIKVELHGFAYEDSEEFMTYEEIKNNPPINIEIKNPNHDGENTSSLPYRIKITSRVSVSKKFWILVTGEDYVDNDDFFSFSMKMIDRNDPPLQLNWTVNIEMNQTLTLQDVARDLDTPRASLDVNVLPEKSSLRMKREFNSYRNSDGKVDFVYVPKWNTHNNGGSGIVGDVLVWTVNDGENLVECRATINIKNQGTIQKPQVLTVDESYEHNLKEGGSTSVALKTNMPNVDMNYFFDLEQNAALPTYESGTLTKLEFTHFTFELNNNDLICKAKGDYFNSDPFVVYVSASQKDFPTAKSEAPTGIGFTVSNVSDGPLVLNSITDTITENENGDTLYSADFTVANPDQLELHYEYTHQAGTTATADDGVLNITIPDNYFRGKSNVLTYYVKLRDINVNPPEWVTAQLSLTVNQKNDAPEFSDQTIILPNGVKTVTRKLAGMDEEDGDDLHYTILSAPLHGTVYLNGKTFTYSQDSSETKDDFFYVKVYDKGLVANDAKFVTGKVIIKGYRDEEYSNSYHFTGSELSGIKSYIAYGASEFEPGLINLDSVVTQTTDDIKLLAKTKIEVDGESVLSGEMVLEANEDVRPAVPRPPVDIDYKETDGNGLITWLSGGLGNQIFNIDVNQLGFQMVNSPEYAYTFIPTLSYIIEVNEENFWGEKSLSTKVSFHNGEFKNYPTVQDLNLIAYEGEAKTFQFTTLDVFDKEDDFSDLEFDYVTPANFKGAITHSNGPSFTYTPDANTDYGQLIPQVITYSVEDRSGLVSTAQITIDTKTVNYLSSNSEGELIPNTDAFDRYHGVINGNFSVNQFGAATYTLPLSFAPGRGNMTPQLAMSYSSFGQNGVMGKGWNLSGLSEITRSSKKRKGR